MNAYMRVLVEYPQIFTTIQLVIIIYIVANFYV